jgi:Pyruvate/2-oxoacid:ferredoxin oxidoreductase delta subunit
MHLGPSLFSFNGQTKPRKFNNPRKRTLQVVPQALRCMQCGLCSYNCPAGIDVRNYAWEGIPVNDSRCLTCGMCVASCPRSALALQQIDWPNGMTG